MISRAIDDNRVSLAAEDADDLLSLRRLIKAGDRVTGDTTRVVKRDAEYSRPDRGQRVRVRVSLRVEGVSLDSAVDRLRISGTILESTSEAVPHGSHHSMVVRVSEPFTVHKRRWDATERRLAGPGGGGGGEGFVLVAIDRSECGIARLGGAHLEVMPNIYSGASGKRYKGSGGGAEGFFREAAGALRAAAREGDRVIVFGPGETKRRFANHAGGAPGGGGRGGGGPPGPGRGGPVRIEVVEGIDSGGEDGIYTFTKSEAMKEIMAGSKIARIAGIVDSVMLMASRKSPRFAMGFEDAERASRHGAVESLVFSDRIFEGRDEGRVVEFLNEAESRGAEVFSADSSTDLGLRVAGLGGVVATLRFAVGGAG